MFKFIIFAILIYILYRQVKKLLTPRQQPPVQGNRPTKSQQNLRNVEDADFEEIE